jgi:acetolactate synthase-1/2/3 large subunit
MHGGDRIAAVLESQGVRFLFTLCGGHISPILTGAKARGLRVVDVRHEATAVFAADAVARLTGVPGVAAVTAGPGVTNTITALKNAQMAQSPVVVLGGATATMLKGRGALQDIDQMALVRPHVKWAGAATRVRELAPMLEHAFAVERAGVPGPTFLECPVDLLYDEALVRGWYGAAGGSSRGVMDRARRFYLGRHVTRLFAGPLPEPAPPRPADHPRPRADGAAALLKKSARPLLLLGSQALPHPGAAAPLVRALESLGIPAYLSGMARGLLGASHPLQLRHHRREALREADLVILAGVPCDFRLDYGRHIGRRASLIAVNRERSVLRKNRRPRLALADAPDAFLAALSEAAGGPGAWRPWIETLRARDGARDAEIAAQAREPAEGGLNPLRLLRALEAVLPDDSVLVADGGDFVSTASYVLRPRGPLSWLDPGPFGTLGAGAGFALGARLARPSAEVWLLYGDGSAGYSLAEADTFARHGLPVLALVGNDGAWTQIAREQVEVLHDDVGTVLAQSDYHRVAEGLGAVGLALRAADEPERVLREAQARAREGRPVYVNALMGRSAFRKGSISM